MRTRAPGIFVNGIWKSGNHLVYSALNELNVTGPFSGVAAHLLFQRRKFLKRILRGAWPGIGGIDVGLETEARLRPSYIRYTLRRLSGRIIGGHAAHTPELVELLRQEGARTIMICRDPRDILVSFADWIEGRPDYFMHPDFVGLSREARVERLLRGGTGIGYKLRSFNEVLGLAQPWLNEGEDILVVRFEDLVGPKGGGSFEKQAEVLAGICRHLDLTPPEDSAWMDRIHGGSLTFNKGRVQRWREIDSLDLKDEISERLSVELARWGYAQEEIDHHTKRSHPDG